MHGCARVYSTIINELDLGVELCSYRKCLIEKWPQYSIMSVFVALTRRKKTWVPCHQSRSCSMSCVAQKQPVSSSLLSPSGILNWQDLNSNMPGLDPSLLNAVTFRLFENKNWHKSPESNLVICLTSLKSVHEICSSISYIRNMFIYISFYPFI